MKGGGTVVGNGTAHGTVAPGGTMTFSTGGLTLANDSTLAITLADDTVDKVKISIGDLTLSGGTVSFNVSGTQTPGMAYVFASYGGTLTGAFGPQSVPPTG